MKNPEFYTEAEITSFGEYLLSAQRLETLFPDADPAGVYHSDIKNWKAKVGGAGVEMGEENPEAGKKATKMKAAFAVFSQAFKDWNRSHE